MNVVTFTQRPLGRDSEHHDWDGEEIPGLILKHVEVIQAGTGRGRTAVRLLFEGYDGKKYWCNTTARQLLMQMGAIKGTMELFGDNPNES